MGVASIPDHKDQRTCDEWNVLGPIGKMDVAKGATEDFVTVVSVGNQSPPENFVTVLSIGAGKKEDEPPPASPGKGQANGVDGHLEEEVEVFRLPGERLGFGLKFEGGNKTSERVRRLFVQSCAEQSPASRAKCSWGTLGEGDEVLSIDGVPVTHMTRLDCVRRLKESQLVIRLMVRCRGALRPEVVSAERKTSPEKSKVPPELPSAPPPVPPRKLRQTRGSADGEANPSPVKKSWPSSRSQSSSQTSSQTNSPGSQGGNQCSKSTSYESCESSPRSLSSSIQGSPKGSPKERSPDLTKSKQEPPEAMVYLDARSQCGSTHGSTSDDTGSSMSTVVDRFSTSDRVSTISTASTASTASEQPGELSRADQDYDRSSDRDLQLPRAICPFEQLEKEFTASPPDYLLRRLASSEAVTHVESRGEVERITAVVAPNTVLIEETITFQPPLSFQDAPLSYGHEPRPDLFYAADLAADSTTHFRPIKDDAELVERVNGDHEEFRGAEATVPEKTRETSGSDKTPPPLPARNHVNRIAVNQPANDAQNEPRSQNLSDLPVAEASDARPDAPVLPPKPLPRKDVKVRRKRPPPPPPPPHVAPRKDVKPPPSVETRQTNVEKESGESIRVEVVENSCKPIDTLLTYSEVIPIVAPKPASVKTSDEPRGSESEPESCKRPDREKSDSNVARASEEHGHEVFDSFDYQDGGGYKTNKVLEIIEIRKARALSPQKGATISYLEENEIHDASRIADDNARHDETEKEIVRVEVIVNNESSRSEILKSGGSVSAEFEHSDEETSTKRINCPKQLEQKPDGPAIRQLDVTALKDDKSDCCESSVQRGSEDDGTYRSLDEIDDDLNGSTVNRAADDDEEMLEEDDSTDESDDDGDYYWQSNLATIGEEEETNSLEYTSANKETSDAEVEPVEKPEISQQPLAGRKDAFGANARNDEVEPTGRIEDLSGAEAKKLNAETVNGRMDNCGGGQRLPPDGDEFPAAYQEFSSSGSSNGTGNGSGNQQYRFVAATRTATMTTNGGLVCSESEGYVGVERNFKLLESSVVATKSIILPDSRVSLTNVEGICQDGGKKVAASNVEINGKMTMANAEGLCQDANALSRVDESKAPYASDDFAKKSLSVNNYSNYGAQPANNVVMSEKKIEITGYYHKDVSVIGEVQDHDKEAATDVPPPLPLTGPPKMETIHAKSVLAVEQPQRKFSLNGELWRQDDKSERSVRDKIAMFSSQSSLDTPLFPNAVTVTAVTSNGRRLSKYKSSEDVCNDEKSPGQKERSSFFADRTQSSFDLTDSARNFNQDPGRKYGQRSPSLPQASPLSPTIHTSKTLPVVPQKPCVSLASSTSEKPNVPTSPTKCYVPMTASQPASPQSAANSNVGKNPGSPSATLKPGNATALTRATSFSGSMPYAQDRGSTAGEHLSSNSQVARTNSLASTFRRPAEEIRRASLNQLIEQRRRSISKLRGLVIPEKEAVPIDQPIVDLPEIKSRDSILLHQIPKANIQDKWGSQSSLASNTSTASAPLKATTSFKMPAPQIHSKYSPAFKRKSLAVYGSSTTGTSVNGSKVGPTSATSTPTAISEPPKSLESICSPTRSDYSFEFVSTSSSPEGSRNRPRAVQRKTRMDYDDSDNDSAVSSSQSSISRGFSPPMSPVPSERSTVSSERSYVSTETNYQRRSLIMDSPTRTYVRESSSVEYSSRPSILGERAYVTERSSSSSSSSNPRSPQPTDVNSRNSQIPQRQLRRSNSTDTNCSTSSTLTSGSQASAESLSRRVLKPQSVEAINRKNILASARCRSGRDLNGSPLIQRKFSDDEDLPTSNENGHQRTSHGKSASTGAQDIKIAYIEVTDPFMEDDSCERSAEEPKLPPKRSVPAPAARPPKSEMLEPSNDLKMWVRAEAKALVRSTDERSTGKTEKLCITVQEPEVSPKITAPRNSRVSSFEDNEVVQEHRNTEDETDSTLLESTRQRTRPQVPPKKPVEEQNDLLTILTTKSRSRSAIHVDDGTFGRSRSQMSLEDILGAKTDPKLSRAQNIEGRTEKNGDHANAQNRPSWDTKDSPTRYARRSATSANETWSEDRGFVSKIPTLGRSRFVDNGDDAAENDRARSTLSKIPTPRNLSRRSASVTDMKKALEKGDANSTSAGQAQNSVSGHNRFPSLDSSVDENAMCTIGGDGETERCYEQFGSISSLASSTSLISQQELAQLVEEASLEEARGAHDVIVVLLHKENPTGSVGITLAGGADCEVKEITVHRVLAHSIADKDGRVQRGDRILSINGRSTRVLTHRESLAVLKQPRSEVVLVVSRSRIDEGCKLRSRTASVETIIEGFETNGLAEDTAWGPPSVVAVYKDGAGLGFSLEGGRDSPLGDRPLVIKKIFTGGAAEKTGALKAGDQLLEVNGNDVTRMSRIEAWSLMKKLHDGEVNLLVRHPATKSS